MSKCTLYCRKSQWKRLFASFLLGRPAEIETVVSLSDYWMDDDDRMIEGIQLLLRFDEIHWIVERLIFEEGNAAGIFDELKPRSRWQPCQINHFDSKSFDPADPNRRAISISRISHTHTDTHTVICTNSPTNELNTKNNWNFIQNSVFSTDLHNNWNTTISFCYQFQLRW